MFDLNTSCSNQSPGLLALHSLWPLRTIIQFLAVSPFNVLYFLTSQSSLEDKPNTYSFLTGHVYQIYSLLILTNTDTRGSVYI